MDRPSAETIVRTSINLVRLLAVLSDPLIPETARKVFDALAASSDERRWPVDVAVKTRRPGRRVQHIDLLFRRITDAETAEWTARFAGAEPPPVAFHADRE